MRAKSVFKAVKACPVVDIATEGEDKGWLARQAAQTAKDIKQLPSWLRTDEDTSDEQDEPSAERDADDPY